MTKKNRFLSVPGGSNPGGSNLLKNAVGTLVHSSGSLLSDHRNPLQNYTTLLAIINYLSIGIFVIDHNSAVVTSNIAAENLLKLTDKIRLTRDSKIRFSDIENNKLVDDFINPHARDSIELQSRQNNQFIIRSNTESGYLFVEMRQINILPEGNDSAIGYSMMMLINPQIDIENTLGRASHTFEFTNAEKDVCRFLLVGNTNKHIAKFRNVSLETTKSQVNAILRKTESANRSELVRVISSLSIPIAV